MTDLDNLERLNRLRENGALTEEEFQFEKLKVLSGEAPNKPTHNLKWVLLSGAILLVVAALAVAFWPRQGKNEAALKPEIAETGQPLDAPRLETNETNNASVIEKAEPAPLAFATSTEVLGLNPAYLEKRLGVPKEKKASYIVFEVGGCTISYGIDKGSVTRFDVDINQNCQPTIQGVKVSPQTTYGQVFGRETWGKYLASCLYGCGNAADPIVYLTYPGSRATGFVSVNYATDYDQVSNALDLWEKAVRRQRGLGEFETPDDYDAFSCVSGPPAEVVTLLRKARVRSVGVDQEMPRLC